MQSGGKTHNELNAEEAVVRFSQELVPSSPFWAPVPSLGFVMCSSTAPFPGMAIHGSELLVRGVPYAKG